MRNPKKPAQPKVQSALPWSAPYSRLQTSPTTIAIAIVPSVSTNPTTALARNTSGRRGSRAKVTIAVRWLHSAVTSMMPSTGSSTAVTKAAAATKSPYDIGSSWLTVTASTMPSVSTTSSPIVASSQKPARVSYDLRSSTRSRRANGVGVVEEMSSECPSAGAALVTSLHLRSQDAPDAHREREDQPQQSGGGQLGPLLAGDAPVDEGVLGVGEVDPGLDLLEPVQQRRAELEQAGQHERVDEVDDD